MSESESEPYESNSETSESETESETETSKNETDSNPESSESESESETEGKHKSEPRKDVKPMDKYYKSEMTYWANYEFRQAEDAYQYKVDELSNLIMYDLILFHYANEYIRTEYKTVDPGLSELKYSTDEKGNYFDLADIKYLVSDSTKRKHYPRYELKSGKYYLTPDDATTAYYLDPAKIDDFDIEYIHLCLTQLSVPVEKNVLTYDEDKTDKVTYANIKEIPYVTLKMQQVIVKKYHKIKKYADKILGL